MNNRVTMAVIFPLLAVLVITVVAGGIGVTFMVLESAVPDAWGVIGLGSAFVVGVPAAAAILQRTVEKE